MLQYKRNPGKKLVTIEVDRIRFPARYLGKGKFSKVYQIGSRVVYYTRGDCSKEVLSMFQNERITHLPELIRHDNIRTSKGIWYVFSSPFYRNVTKKDYSAWKMMKQIQYSADRFRQALYLRGERVIYLMQAIINSMEEDKAVSRSVIRALQIIVDVASNCGDNVAFDFHNRNFGVNEYGTLIFRDPFFVAE